jgi:CubicO group peptidase (beta-lactamase class C family)
METPDTTPPPRRGFGRVPGRGDLLPGRAEGIWGLGERLTWVSALVLAVSAFTGWYQGDGDEGPTLSVIGWHTGWLGQVVFFIGLAVLALVALREAGIDLPAGVPESLIVIGLGSVATILVLIRVIEIPEEFLPAEGRGAGLWIALVASLGVILAGLLEAAEEL